MLYIAETVNGEMYIVEADGVVNAEYAVIRDNPETTVKRIVDSYKFLCINNTVKDDSDENQIDLFEGE